VYGTYDKSRSATANIGLPDSILSRFDLLFVVLDSQTAERDKRIADHVLRSHRYREDASAGASLTRTDDANDALLAASNVNSEPVTSPVWSNASGAARVAGVQGEAADSILTMEFMKKFIYYARTRSEPSLTAEARDAIAHADSDLRANAASLGGRMSLPITPRTLETIIRLSTAYARCSLSKLISQVAPSLCPPSPCENLGNFMRRPDHNHLLVLIHELTPFYSGSRYGCVGAFAQRFARGRRAAEGTVTRRI
jgi:DNA replication licensing factor MCM3